MKESESALARKMLKQQVKRFRVDLSGLETAHQVPAGLHRVQGFPQLFVFREQAAQCENALHHEREFVSVDRFGEIISGAHSQRADRALDRRIARQQHEIGSGIAAPDLFEEFDTRKAWHGEIRDDQIRGLAVQGLEGRL